MNNLMPITCCRGYLLGDNYTNNIHESNRRDKYCSFCIKKRPI